MIRESSQNFVPHVVIIGAGFGGIEAAKTLGGKAVKVTLIDRNNHHTFQPLLYQVATAGLSPADIAVPIRSVLSRYLNIEVLLATVTSIDVHKKLVHLEDEEISYDYLIVAAGATHSYFGHSEWSNTAPGLKSIEDATEIRRRVLLAFENAERHPDDVARKGLLTFAIVGGGPTGVELAGALAELARYTLSRDFRHIRAQDARIILIEAGPRILASFPPELAAKAEATLRKLGVELMLGSPVTSIDDGVIRLDTQTLNVATVIWAAGVRASQLSKQLDAPLDKAGRVLVKNDLSLPAHQEVFVVGDLAFLTRENGEPVPGVAPAALQEGKHAAKNILGLILGAETVQFRYRDKGNLATVGRASAIADFGRLKIDGYLAWLLWIFVHVFFLIGFRNRAVVLFQWAIAYFTYERGARLITRDIWTGADARPLLPRVDSQ